MNEQKAIALLLGEYCAPGYDSGESSADCLRKTISNPNYAEALKEMEK